MPVFVQCPSCGKSGKVRLDYVGRAVRCPDCDTKFEAKITTVVEYPKAEPYVAPPDFPLDIPVDNGDAHQVPDWLPHLPPEVPKRIGRFEIRKFVGGGGFKDVYEAYDPVLEREVALKVPHRRVLQDPRRVKEFLQEAKSAARLKHPHIVKVFDSGQDGDKYYIAEEFIAGHNLEEELKGRPLAPARAAQIARDLAGALAYAHGHLIHRDVKSLNIMLDQEGQPHLVDFGLASRLDVDKEALKEVEAEKPEAKPETTDEPATNSTPSGPGGNGQAEAERA